MLRYKHWGRWLDVGFGNGSLVTTAAEFGYEVVGLDLREEGVRLMREFGYEAHSIPAMKFRRIVMWGAGGRLLVGSLVIFWLVAVGLPSGAWAGEQWSVEQANKWYSKQPWLVGCNFAPSTGINQLEMWQADTFDSRTIDRELGWAASIGMNTVRVFLHDLPYQQDAIQFFSRIDKFLELADKHKIRPLVVFFDGVWDPDPQAGPQRRPRTGVHNSGWVQSPGRVVLVDPRKQDALKPYVTDVLKRYGRDSRVLMWDLFNEPDNPNSNSYGPLELKNKDDVAEQLVRKTFAWAREVGPTQPLTVGLWRGPEWDSPHKLNKVHTAALELSDVISFHDYNRPQAINRRIAELRQTGRPLFCTEFLARGNGSTFEAILPILKKEKIAAYCWGLVDGKTNTKYPWATWQMPEVGEPDPWQHEIFHPNGKPYREVEVKLIKELTGKR